jgi:hypothetical protein
VRPPRVWHGNVRITSARRREEVSPVTVTIGAICGAESISQTGSIVLCADTLVTWTSDGVPVTSNPTGSKLFDLPLGFYGAISDDISRAVQVRSYLYHVMQSIPEDDTRRLDLIEAAIDATGEYVRSWMRQDILSRHGITIDEYLHDSRLAARAEIQAEIANEAIPTQMIIGGFSRTGSPVLIFTDCTHFQHQTSPGFFCGGAGGGAALDWLNMREQNSFMSVQRTAYHIHEAKRFAERSPVVGQRHQAILLRHNHPVVSVGGDRPLLLRWLGELMPRSTSGLDNAQAWEDFAQAYGINPSTNSSGDQT